MILALDCASKTGWAIARNDGSIVESGMQNFTKKRGESNGLMFLRFRKWIVDTVKLSKSFMQEGDDYVLVAYEKAHFRGGAATEICVGLQTRCQEVAVEFGYESAGVATGTLKVVATGKGKASKAEMIKAAEHIIGRPPVDDNEADAVMIAQWAAQTYTNVTKA